MSSKIEIINLSEVEADFKRYSRLVDAKNRKTLQKYAMLIKNRMKWILRQRVITWTGFLANSITVTSRNTEATIQPNAPYANWIEVGGKGGFKGYHYVEEGVDRYKDEYLDEIQKNLE